MGKKDHLSVGSHTLPDENGEGERMERELYGQGMIFKSDEVFYDMEHPETLLEDRSREGEVDTCGECREMFSCYGETQCPHCGAAYEGGDS